MGDLRTVSLTEIRENPVALRTVNRTSEEYQGLVQSISQKGFLGAITVRPRTDEKTGESFYELIDGLHRFSAAKDAGLEEINVDVVDLNEDEILEAQIMANIHRIETKPVEYTNQLRKILARNPMMTEAELANRLGRSASWINQRLKLHRITNPEIQALVNSGEIALSNAYALAKLPESEQADFVQRAVTDKPDVFIEAVNARVKELKEAARQGKDAEPAEFQPQSFLQKLKDVRTEYESGSVRQALFAQHSPSTAEDGWNLCIQWMQHLDPQSVAAQKAKADELKAQRAEAKQKKDAERAAKAAEKAKAKAAEAEAKAAEAAAAVSG